jgi:hypothetical protein
MLTLLPDRTAFIGVRRLMDNQDSLTKLVSELRKAVIQTELKRGRGPRRPPQRKAA